MSLLRGPQDGEDFPTQCLAQYNQVKGRALFLCKDHTGRQFCLTNPVLPNFLVKTVTQPDTVPSQIWETCHLGYLTGPSRVLCGRSCGAHVAQHFLPSVYPQPLRGEDFWSSLHCVKGFQRPLCSMRGLGEGSSREPGGTGLCS